MARENVMSTPIFDQLLREMAQRAEPRATTATAGAPRRQAEAETPQERAETAAPRRLLEFTRTTHDLHHEVLSKANKKS